MQKLILFFYLTLAFHISLAKPIHNLAEKNSKKKAIYDNDLMFDDWFGLLYLLKADVFDVIGVTVAGNGEANCQFVRPIVAELLKIAEVKKDIPTRCGATSPLDGYFTFPYDWRKGANTMHGLIPYSEKEYNLKLNEEYNQELEARDFIIEQLEKNDELDIIAVGPLSNIAMVIKDRPDLIKKISKVWIMGGNVFVPGNIGNNPYPAIDHLINQSAEWNFWTDIESAKIVFDSGVKISLIPLDATNSVPVSVDFVEKYNQEVKLKRSKVGEFISWNYNLPFIKQWLKDDRFYFWDTLAVGIAMNPSMCLEWKSLNLTVNNQKTSRYFTYTDKKAPNFTKLNVYGEKRNHFHPIIAGTLIETPEAQLIDVCVKGNKELFYNDFLRKTIK